MPQQVLLIIFLIFSVISCSSAPKKTESLILPSDIQIDSAICRDTTTRDNLIEPIKQTEQFYTGDPQVVMWVKAENVKGKHTLRWEWLTPDGDQYHDVIQSVGEEGKRHEIITGAHKVGIYEEKAERLKGKWHVKVYLDDYLRINKSFILDEGPPADIDMYIKKGPVTPVKKDSSKWGVVIGIENYKMTFPAQYARKDAETVKEYLMKFMGVIKVFTFTDSDATGAVLKDFLSRKIHEYVSEGDTVYFYYAGHGVPDYKTETVEKPIYILPNDGNPENISGTAYSLERLYADLNSLKAKEVYVFLDACFTGEAGRSETRQSIIAGRPAGDLIIKDPVLASNKQMLLLASSEKNQISSSIKEEEHGLFTYFLLKGMIGEADTNNDGVIRAAELYKYISDKMESKTTQWRSQRPILKKSLIWEGIDPLIVRIK